MKSLRKYDTEALNDYLSYLRQLSNPQEVRLARVQIKDVKQELQRRSR